MSLVIDASIAIAWSAPDEINAHADHAMAKVLELGATVPALWFLEVANVLAMNERKGRLHSEEVAEILGDLDAMPIIADSESPRIAFRRTLELARIHRLTVYDAAYLELMLRLGAHLATLDQSLLAAARTEGVAFDLPHAPGTASP